MRDATVTEIVDQVFARADTVSRDDLVAFVRAGGVDNEWVRRFETLPEGRLTRREVLEGLGEAEGDGGIRPLRNIQ